VAGLALCVQLHDLLDEGLVDLEQRVDALLLARVCDGRNGRRRDGLDGRLGHGQRHGGRVHRLGEGGHAGRVLCRSGIGGGAVGVGDGVAGAGRRGGLAGLRVGMDGRREALGKGRGRVGARRRLLLVLWELLVLLLLLEVVGYMAGVSDGGRTRFKGAGGVAPRAAYLVPGEAGSATGRPSASWRHLAAESHLAGHWRTGPVGRRGTAGLIAVAGPVDPRTVVAAGNASRAPTTRSRRQTRAGAAGY
jgi:hypothetical protein